MIKKIYSTRNFTGVEFARLALANDNIQSNQTTQNGAKSYQIKIS